ncbi:MAG TPA: two-component system response regulator DcuR [Sporomusaceae bacterium]|jgi:CitB family two-component system response regulator MalR|nr:dcuR [Anaerospora sp.]HAK75050.1 two-component system response regulator DcuR [Sporomusaceae bacterium]
MIRVLIVEDDPMVAEFNRRYLEKVDGFVATAVARSAREALTLLESLEVDLILLDLFMPGMNGLELLAQIREQRKGVDVLIVTAACDSPSIKQALRNGAIDYLIKPFEFERLSAALADYRNQVLFMRNRASVSQEELDRQILGKEQQEQADLMKGLDRNTLKTVWDKIREITGTAFTTEELANQVGISRVSMRKYLEFLKQIDVLQMEVIYGSVGRPVYKYRCAAPDCSIIKRYL